MLTKPTTSPSASSQRRMTPPARRAMRRLASKSPHRRLAASAAAATTPTPVGNVPLQPTPPGEATKTTLTANKRHGAPTLVKEPKAKKHKYAPNTVHRTKRFPFHEEANTKPFSEQELWFAREHHREMNSNQIRFRYYRPDKLEAFHSLREAVAKFRTREIPSWDAAHYEHSSRMRTLGEEPPNRQITAPQVPQPKVDAPPVLPHNPTRPPSPPQPPSPSSNSSDDFSSGDSGSASSVDSRRSRRRRRTRRSDRHRRGNRRGKKYRRRDHRRRRTYGRDNRDRRRANKRARSRGRTPEDRKRHRREKI